MSLSGNYVDVFYKFFLSIYKCEAKANFRPSPMNIFQVRQKKKVVLLHNLEISIIFFFNPIMVEKLNCLIAIIEKDL